MHNSVKPHAHSHPDHPSRKMESEDKVPLNVKICPDPEGSPRLVQKLLGEKYREFRSQIK